ncbi:MAG: dTDP-4-dehydrorhamnose reductase [SAR324 cluster bacterium]|nr:dTDP-4-dehydrorhamnose reductase [SAR324 cluster bacterium]
MTTAIIGANGQLGQDLCKVFGAQGDEVVGLNHGQMEITRIDSVREALQAVRPRLVVNTAAMHQVESCEAHPGRAFTVNAIGARNLAEVCSHIDAVLVHISTDYVFDGNQDHPYTENDPPLPLNVYGNSKLAGEHFVRTRTARHFVIRVSGLYGHAPCRAKGGLNFVELMLKLAGERPQVRVVDNEVLTPTFTLDLARQVAHLARSDAFGLYHATAAGDCSWYAFAREIFRLAGLTTPLQVAHPDEFPAKAPRPLYSVLANQGLQEHGLDILLPWREGLAEYFASR